MNRVGYLIPTHAEFTDESGQPHGAQDGFTVCCEGCAPSYNCLSWSGRLIPIYEENIYPYRQDCVGCGELLALGQTDKWPTLFDGSPATALADTEKI